MNQTALIYRQPTMHNAAKEYPNKREHTATLRRFYSNPHRRLPQAFTHKPNKRKRKESPLPFCASTHSTTASRLSPLVPRASCLSSTCASQQLAPLSNVRLSATCASQHVLCHVRLASTSSRKQLQLSSGRVPTRPLSSSPECFSTRAPSCAPLTYSALLSPSTTAPRPLLGALHPCPPIGRTRHPSPLPFLASETGRGG